MKEVRLNDKFWFGKHKGARVSDIIKHDPNFIQKIVKEGKIKLDDKSRILFEQKYGSTPDGQRIRREPPRPIENIGIRNDEPQRTGFNSIVTVPPNANDFIVRETVRSLFNNIRRHSREEISDEIIDALTALFFRKIINDVMLDSYELGLTISAECVDRRFGVVAADDIVMEMMKNRRLLKIYNL